MSSQPATPCFASHVNKGTWQWWLSDPLTTIRYDCFLTIALLSLSQQLKLLLVFSKDRLVLIPPRHLLQLTILSLRGPLIECHFYVQQLNITLRQNFSQALLYTCSLHLVSSVYTDIQTFYPAQIPCKPPILVYHFPLKPGSVVCRSCVVLLTSHSSNHPMTTLIIRSHSL